MKMAIEKSLSRLEDLEGQMDIKESRLQEEIDG